MARKQKKPIKKKKKRHHRAKQKKRAQKVQNHKGLWARVREYWKVIGVLFSIVAFSLTLYFGITGAKQSDAEEIKELLNKEKDDRVTYAEGQQITEGIKPPRRTQELAAKIPDDSDPHDLAIKAFVEGRYIDARPLLIEAQKQEETELATVYDTRGLLESYAGNYPESTKWYEEAYKLKPDDPDALFFLANAYSIQGSSTTGNIAFEHFTVASGTYKEVLQLKPDFLNAFINDGVVLYEKSKMKEGKERDDLINEAKVQFLKAESIKTGSGAYNLARVDAFQNNEEECRKWLELGGREGTLPQKKYADNNPYFDSMREKEWFKQIRWSEGTEK